MRARLLLERWVRTPWPAFAPRSRVSCELMIAEDTFGTVERQHRRDGVIARVLACFGNGLVPRRRAPSLLPVAWKTYASMVRANTSSRP